MQSVGEKSSQKMQVILSALCLPDFIILRGLSTLFRCSRTLAQDIPFHKIPLINDCCNYTGSCTLRPYLTIVVRNSSPRVSYKFLQDNQQLVPCQREFQAQPIFTRALVLKRLEFATSHTRTYRISNAKRRLVSIAFVFKPGYLNRNGICLLYLFAITHGGGVIVSVGPTATVWGVIGQSEEWSGKFLKFY